MVIAFPASKTTEEPTLANLPDYHQRPRHQASLYARYAYINIWPRAIYIRNTRDTQDARFRWNGVIGPNSADAGARANPITFIIITMMHRPLISPVMNRPLARPANLSFPSRLLGTSANVALTSASSIGKWCAPQIGLTLLSPVSEKILGWTKCEAISFFARLMDVVSCY